MYSRIKLTYTCKVLIVGEAVRSIVISPVKTANFIRTVISTIFCTDTAVISHLVKALTAMISGTYRAHIFTWCIITVLAHQRLKYNLWVFHITTVVAVDAQPVHIMKTLYFTLANNRNIIFQMTGNNTGATTDTTVEVNIQTPVNTGFIIIWINGTLLFI